MRALIFDLDGTLGDTLPICCEAFRRAAEPLTGKRFTDEEIHATFGPSEEGSVHVLTPGRGTECLEAYLRHYDELHVSCAEPFEGVRDLLDVLRERGIRVALVTGKGPHTCAISLRHLGLEGCFEHVEIGSADGPCKPEAIRRILAAWGIPGDEVAYVGDSPSDVNSARAGGVHAIGAAWAATADPKAIAARNPDKLFTSVAELREWVLAHTDSGDPP